MSEDGLSAIDHLLQELLSGAGSEPALMRRPAPIVRRRRRQHAPGVAGAGTVIEIMQRDDIILVSRAEALRLAGALQRAARRRAPVARTAAPTYDR